MEKRYWTVLNEAHLGKVWTSMFRCLMWKGRSGYVFSGPFPWLCGPRQVLLGKRRKVRMIQRRKVGREQRADSQLVPTSCDGIEHPL